MESQHYLTPSLFKHYQLFSLMSRPVTRAKNANQHPGRIVLDMKQRHRTSEQKRQDDARIKQEKTSRMLPKLVPSNKLLIPLSVKPKQRKTY